MSGLATLSHKETMTRIPYFAFLSLMLSTLFMYFLALGMSVPTANLVVYMNDAHKAKSLIEWVAFVFIGVISSAVWCALWVWFKRSEKVCVDHFTRSKQA